MRLRLTSGENTIWLLSGLVVLLAMALYIATVRDLPAVSGAHLPWWALTAMFYVAERCVVHLQFRRSAQSFSLGDLPLVFGLLFAGASDLILGGLLGTALVLLTERRQEAIKIVFNLAQLYLSICLALLVLHAMVGGGHELDAQVWTAIFLATQASALMAVALTGAAISLSDGSVSARMLVQIFSLDAVITLTNTSVALLAAVIAETNPSAMPLLVVPFVAVFFAYRAYVLERQKHEKLEFLHEATRTLSRSPEVITALEDLLQRSLEAFRAERAEIILSSSGGGGPLRITLGPGEHREVMQPAEPDLAEGLLELVSGGSPAVRIQRPFGTEALRRGLEPGTTDAMVALLPGEERVIGTIMLANRLGVMRSFSGEELKLLQTLASNASVALQYDLLEQAVTQLETARDQLEHRASHDALTGLANRAFFTEQLGDALALDSMQVGVLFVDVDDFKGVNDTLGHSAGDQVLVAVAQRAHECVLPSDVVARLGGDEFAVMVRDQHDAVEAALAVTRRLMEALDRPIRIGDQTLSIHVSVGITTTRHGSYRAGDLIHEADLAMYQAKAAGKHRYQLFDPEMQPALKNGRGRPIPAR